MFYFDWTREDDTSNTSYITRFDKNGQNVRDLLRKENVSNIPLGATDGWLYYFLLEYDTDDNWNLYRISLTDDDPDPERIWKFQLPDEFL
ncbi:MAG: hypothetical protein LBN36_05870 [Clostridiales Family XIII bacterium]|nr:hypothetical protein [Clostridiales Family XIII bacterium]